MKRIISFLVVLVFLGIAAGAGYWLGANKAGPAQAHKGGPAQAPEQIAKPDRKVLYYRNPMGLPDTSPLPKKDAMGMDYIPVYEGEEAQGAGVTISPDRVQKLGVKTEVAALRSLAHTIRAVGTIQVDERAQRTVAPRFEGWIQRLHVSVTGQYVRRGQPLMDVYGPDLVAAQQEYMVAIKGVDALKEAGPEMLANMRSLAEASLQRLRNWDIDEAELARLTDERRPGNTITLRSPVSGVVLEKPSVEGMRFMPGEMLYKIADLSSVWLLADIFEQDIGLVRPGQAVRIQVNAYPDRNFQGRVAFVYPTLTPETRTGRARIDLQNPGLLLKPAMYASLELTAGAGRDKRLSVPDSAVLDSGTRQIVLVRRGEGRFEPREVKLGLRGDGYVEVREGVKAGEEIVVSANFLIDAESNLRAAIGGFGQSARDAQTDARKPAPGAGRTHSAEGMVVNVDPKAGLATITHGAVASLKWDGMTMEFKVADAALFASLKAGEKVRIEIAERAPGDWTVVRATPLASRRADGKLPAPHPGH
ncbi:MAG: efflux RND transporter periplasmic adaptor subunit [Betaproteobacteria bacterium]|nr:efflux RND transporter periplasmic adaptor subunit [Betaproteobacteria bacterium]